MAEKNNATSGSPSGTTPKLSADNSNQHKRLASGDNVDAGQSSAPKTRW